MNQFEREERRKMEEAKKDQIDFINECFQKFFKWQLSEGIVVVPFMDMQPTRIEPLITFRKINDEDKKAMEKQIMAGAGLEMAEGITPVAKSNEN